MALKNTDPGNQRRNVAVAAEVFLDYGDFIRTVICFYVQDEDYVDDLLQDFFISLACYPLPEDMQNVESYLYQAITNAIGNADRRKEKYTNCIHEYAERSNHPHRSQKTPQEALVEVEEANRLLELIETHLPHTEAQAVALQYRDGHNAKEIAETMNVGSSTVRGYVSEGLSRIRRLLRDIEARAAE